MSQFIILLNLACFSEILLGRKKKESINANVGKQTKLSNFLIGKREKS